MQKFQNDRKMNKSYPNKKNENEKCLCECFNFPGQF